MRLDWRYLAVCLLVGVVVCAAVGAGAGVVRVLQSGDLSDGRAGSVAGTLVVSAIAGLLIGAALGSVLGALSGVAATVVVRGREEPLHVARGVGLAVGVTYLVVLVVVAGLAGGAGWQVPQPLQWVGIVVPTVLAAVGSARGAREVPTL